MVKAAAAAAPRAWHVQARACEAAGVRLQWWRWSSTPDSSLVLPALMFNLLANMLQVKQQGHGFKLVRGGAVRLCCHRSSSWFMLLHVL
jgi:hypothetical protein